jgi:hypothetical protein
MSKSIIKNEQIGKPQFKCRAVYCISTNVPESPLGSGKSLFSLAVKNLLNSKISK